MELHPWVSGCRVLGVPGLVLIHYRRGAGPRAVWWTGPRPELAEGSGGLKASGLLVDEAVSLPG